MVLDIVIVSVLLVIAIVLLIAEIFFLPGMSVAGIFSLVFYGASIFYAFTVLGTTIGVVTIVTAVVLSLLMIWYFMRSRALDKMALQTNIDSTAPTTIGDNIKVGDEGVTLSRLNPMGRVIINGENVEARSIDYIDEATPIKVVKVEMTTVWVEPVEVK